jgi:hypothetical protein
MRAIWKHFHQSSTAALRPVFVGIDLMISSHQSFGCETHTGIDLVFEPPDEPSLRTEQLPVRNKSVSK